MKVIRILLAVALGAGLAHLSLRADTKADMKPDDAKPVDVKVSDIEKIEA